MKISYDYGHLEGGQDGSANGIVYEYAEVRKYGAVAIAALKAAGHECVDCTPPNGTKTLNESLAYRVNKANASGSKLHLCFHINAFNGSAYGAEVEICGTGGEAEKYANAVLNEIGALGFYKRGVKTPSLYVTKNTDMPAILIEPFFCDNANDCKIYDANKLGNAIAKAVISIAGGSYNPTPAPIPPVTNLYRVRKSWDDTKSQIGAFGLLENAKECVDKNPGYIAFDIDGKQVYPEVIEEMYRVRKTWEDAKTQMSANRELEYAKKVADSYASAGYKVFNSKGEIVYTPKVEPAPIPTPAPVEPVKIVKHSLMGEPEVTAEQMTQFLFKHNPSPKINCTFLQLAKSFLEEGKIEGIRGDIAFAQAIHETGFFAFGGDVIPDQNNFAGIGTVGGGVKGAYFKTPTEGIRAQIQHLKAYASTEGLKSPQVDPRYSLVTKGVAPNLEDLAGKWAVPGYPKSKYSSIDEAFKGGETYGQLIYGILSEIKKEVVIPTPTPTPIPQPEPTPVPTPEPVKPQPTEPTEPAEESGEVKAVKFIKYIVDFIKWIASLFKGGH